MKRGFTMIEILIVIVVLGILVGIAAIGYGNWQQSLRRKTITSDLKAAASAMEQHRNFNNEYPTTLPSTFVQNSTINVIYVQNSGDKGFCLEGTDGPRGSLKLNWKSSRGSVEEGGCI